MPNPAVPTLNTPEPVVLTSHDATSALTVDPWAISVMVLVPSGTTAIIEFTGGSTVDVDQDIVLEVQGRPIASGMTITRASGAGTVTVIVARVAGKAGDNA